MRASNQYEDGLHGAGAISLESSVSASIVTGEQCRKLSTKRNTK